MPNVQASHNVRYCTHVANLPGEFPLLDTADDTPEAESVLI